jgi:hypothetical protein
LCTSCTQSGNQVPSFVVGIRVHTFPWKDCTNLVNSEKQLLHFVLQLTPSTHAHPRHLVTTTPPGTRSGRSRTVRTVSDPPLRTQQHITGQHLSMCKNFFCRRFSSPAISRKILRKTLPSPMVHLYMLCISVMSVLQYPDQSLPSLLPRDSFEAYLGFAPLPSKKILDKNKDPSLTINGQSRSYMPETNKNNLQ